MAQTTALDVQTLLEIRNTSQECMERGLIVSSKWLSELLLSVSPTRKKDLTKAHSLASFSTSTPARSHPPQNPTMSFVDPLPVPAQMLTQTSQSMDDQSMESELEKEEQDILYAARSYFEAREFHQVIRLLDGCRSSKGIFLRIYCRFIASEKNSQREWHKLDHHRLQPPTPVNKYLVELYESVKDTRDPWLLFLKALFLSRLLRREEAVETLMISIAGCKWNWSAWSLLGGLLGDGEEISALLQLIPLPLEHILVQIFQIKSLNELQSASETEIQLCNRLLGPEFFPNSLWLMSQRACILYHMQAFGEASAQFEKIFAINPKRVDDIDIYSNILYVLDERLKLSKLAHDFLALDKDRPEVCCLIGNHYSLRADHEKAVMYFRRATQLDRTFLPAWTLMGHEYIEMKNAHGAIEAYRRAVDVNRKDYRAWFGLGQAYELLSMPHYSLHYYQRASGLRPYDLRMWQAQGVCYEEMGRLREAIECFKRALITADPRDTSLNLRLAKVYRTLEEHSEAVAHHRRVVDVCQAENRPVPEYAKSCLEICEYNMRIPNGDLTLAREYLELVATSNAEDVAKAAEMLKNLKVMMEKRGGTSNSVA